MDAAEGHYAAGKLPAAEERFRGCGRGIHESSRKQSKIDGIDLRHRGLCRKARPAGAAAGARGHRGARGARRSKRKILSRHSAGFEERKSRGSRATSEGIREKSADAIGITAPGR